MRGAIVTPLQPALGEVAIEKALPNAIAATELHDLIGATVRHQLIVCDLMGHICVSSTVRAALDLGYRTTVVASSCGTRYLPGGQEGKILADVVHQVALAERFAVIADGSNSTPCNDR